MGACSTIPINRTLAELLYIHMQGHVPLVKNPRLISDEDLSLILDELLRPHLYNCTVSKYHPIADSFKELPSTLIDLLPCDLYNILT